MQFHDAAAIAGTRRTRDGYLVSQARIARAGNIQLYGGAELGRDDMPMVRVYRPEEAVFDGATMASFAFKPVTRLHPDEPVTADTWKATAVGITGGEPARDGEFLTIPMLLMDGETIREVEGGLRELSCGYTVDLAWEPGVTPKGEAYDAKVQRITGNHLALVPRGRAGSACRIGDQAPIEFSGPTAQAFRALAALVTRSIGEDADAEPAPSPTNSTKDRTMPDLRTVVVDGLSIEVTPQGEQAINLLQRRLADATAATDAATQRVRDAEAQARQQIEGLQGQIAALNTNHQQALEAKDGEIAGMKAGHQQALEAKDGEIAALKAQLDPAALDARVAARSGLVAQAKRVLGDGFNPAGVTDADIRKAVVLKAMPKLEDPDKKGEAFFDAAFETVMALVPAASAPRPDAGLRAAIATPSPALVDAAAAAAGTTQAKSAWERNRQALSTAWQRRPNAGQEAR